MKVFITLSTLFAISMARPAYDQQIGGYDQQHHQQYNNAGVGHQQYQQPQKPHIPIIKSDFQQNHDGSYQYQYETGNGIQAAEQGYTKNAGHQDEQIQVAEGYYQYTGDDGIPISLKYVADENGFQPIGDHLPTPPPLPQEILDVYAKIAADPRQNDGDDGQYRKEQHGSHQYQQQQYHNTQSGHQQAYKY